ncbi:PAS domain S-box-containing protein [Pseudarcicella hirudinis]|uniref:histidine kinase n=2 Tax=Pseudarcicella hirudinis TaxID=1079859 RepID=A0A1I5M087_9BACT|nr:PAS domain S-box protein [Pseudarcicella hirudinis]SFP03014.1 PAS domain S-box-containing protein [Pseudarcicella hirudinis]
MAKKIAFIYFLIGILWISSSDTLLDIIAAFLGLNPSIIYWIGIFKGFFYVGITSLILYFYLRKSFRKEADQRIAYQRLFEENPIPMWISSKKEFRFLAVNQAAINKYGYSREEFLKMTIMDIRSASEIERLNNYFQKVSADTPDDFIWKHQTKSGKEFFVRISVMETVFEGTASRFASSTDVDEIIKTQQANAELNTQLIAYKNRLENILSSVSDIIWSCEIDSFKINYINDACTSVYGYTPDEFLTNSDLWFSTIIDEDKAIIGENYKRLLKEGHSESEYRIRHKDGSIRVIYDRNVLVRNQEGLPDSINGVSSDITKAKELQEKIIKDEKNMHALINNTEDLIWLVNKDMQLVVGNDPYLKRIEKITGQKPKQGDYVVYKEKDYALWNRFKVHFDRALAGEKAHFEDSTNFPNEGERIIEINLTPVTDQKGEVTDISCFVRNITDRHLNSRKIKLQNDSLNEIAWLQSHTVRAPLANIIGLVQLINHDDLNDQNNQKILKFLEEESFKLDEIIHKIVQKTKQVPGVSLQKKPTSEL